MWTQAKIKFRQLLFDDSGIAMAYTIVTFLVFFMICISTFALSENIRRKMELQNACDAAAYSAAVVQADMLSRIAVLNRALSWTYFQTSKRHMDYIIDVWIDSVSRQWAKDAKEVQDFNDSSCHPKIPFICYYATSFGQQGTEKIEKEFNNIPEFRDQKIEESDSDYSSAQETYFLEKCTAIIQKAQTGILGLIFQININGNNYSASTVASGLRYLQLGNAITASNVTMTTIQQELAFLTNNNTMQTYIADAVRRVMAKNLSQDQNSQNNDQYKILFSGNYFSNENNEDNLLAYTDHYDWELGAGYNTWWSVAANRIQRSYYSGFLTASYDCFSSLWKHVKVCVPYKFIAQFTRTIKPDKNSAPPVYISSSSDSYMSRITPVGSNQFFTSLQVTTAKLNNSFWGKNGSIVIAAQTESTNPATVLFGNSGIYNKDLYFGEKLLAVSAARAGIRLKQDRATEGCYRVFLPNTGSLSGYTNNVWNLCEDDWDAVMLPIQYAWSDATAENCRFTDITANQILSEVYKKFNRSSDCPSDVNDVMLH